MNGKKINILVVEDNHEACHLIERAIKSFFVDKPLAVFATDTLEEAIQLVHVRGPMAITLLDLELTDSKPENTLKHIYQLGKCVIVMSGVASGTTYRECKRHGARDYIDKPVVIELLIEKIARILDNAEPGHEYIEVQRKAQNQLQQKATVAPLMGSPAVILSPVSSRWLKVILPATGAVVVALGTLVGFIAGSWRTASDMGAEKQGNKDKLERIEADVSEIKAGNKERDRTLDRVRIDVTKILTKAGLAPAPEN